MGQNAFGLLDDSAYLEHIHRMLQDVETNEQPFIAKAAEAVYQSIRAGGLLHVFSTGHSHMIVEELFYRAGGLVPVNPILDDELMLHKGAVSSTINERKAGKAAQVLEGAGLHKGDVLLVSSNTGINTVPVEAALYGKEKGLTVLGVTSVSSSKFLESRHPGGKKLYQVCDIVIDNHAPMGDGFYELPGSGQITGGASTFSSLFIAQRMVLMVENLFLREGLAPPVFKSANIPGGDAFNAVAIRSYQQRIPAFI